MAQSTLWPRRRRRETGDSRDWLGRWGARAALIAVLVGIWQLVAIWQGPFFVPTVNNTLYDGLSTIFSNGYYHEFISTWEQLLLGYLIACGIAVPLGIAIGWSKYAERFTMPYANSLFVTPTAAILPLLIFVAGSGLSFRIVVVILFSFYYPLVNTAAGVRHTDSAFRDLARAFCLSPLSLFRKVLLPATAPYIVAGLRLGLGMAVQGMIIAELWVTSGTGEMLIRLVQVRQLGVYFALILMIVVLAAVLSELLKLLENRLLARGQQNLSRAEQ